MMSAPIVVVTGANRGIGLKFVVNSLTAELRLF